MSGGVDSVFRMCSRRSLPVLTSSSVVSTLPTPARAAAGLGMPKQRYVADSCQLTVEQSDVFLRGKGGGYRLRVVVAQHEHVGIRQFADGVHEDGFGRAAEVGQVAGIHNELHFELVGHLANEREGGRVVVDVGDVQDAERIRPVFQRGVPDGRADAPVQRIEVFGDGLQFLRQGFDFGERVLAELDHPRRLLQRTGIHGRAERITIKRVQDIAHHQRRAEHTQKHGGEIDADAPGAKQERRGQSAQSRKRELPQNEVLQIGPRRPLEVVCKVIALRAGGNEFLDLLDLYLLQRGKQSDGRGVGVRLHLAERAQHKGRPALSGGQQAQLDLKAVPAVRRSSQRTHAYDRPAERQHDEQRA